MRRLAALATCAALACSSEPTVPLGTISSEQAQQLIIERDEARDEVAAVAQRYEAEIAGLRDDVANLRQQLGMAEETAEQAAARAAQYEAGLGKAVERLNEVSQEAAAEKAAAAAAAAYRSAARPAATPERAKLHTIGAPWVQFAGGSVIVTGKIWNSGDVETTGRLIVDLMRDGRSVNQKEQDFEIGPNTDQAYSVTFNAPGFEGTYSANVRMEY